MGEGGFEWTTYEIFEIIVPIILFLTITTAIFIVPKPEFIKNQLLAKNLGYYATQISDRKNLKLIIHNFNKKKIKFDKTDKKIELITEDSGNYITYYYGENLEIIKKNTEIKITTK